MNIIPNIQPVILADKNYKWDHIWETLAAVYLALPWIIFFATWLRPIFAILGLASIVTAFILFKHSSKPEIFTPTINKKQFGLAILILLGLVLFSGISYHFPQAMDYVKHHEVWQDLLVKTWPVHYEVNGEPFFMDYYVAYYLPPTWLAKLFHIPYKIPSIIWAVVGLSLALYGFARIFGKRPILGLLMFFLISGQDLLWIWSIDVLHWFRTGEYVPLPWGEIIVEPLAYLSFIYKGTFDHLLWAPQHALGGWLASLLVFRRLKLEMGNWSSAFPLILSFFWSPFVTVGLMPFVAWDFLSNLGFTWKKLLFVGAGGVFGLIMLLYYEAHEAPGYTGVVWELSTRSDWFLFYLIFLLFELGAFAALVLGSWKIKKPREFQKRMFLFALLSLILIPFFHIGRANDFVMRVSIPGLIIFYSTAINAFFSSWKNRLLRLCFGLSLGLGMILPFVEVYKVWHKEIEKPVQELFPTEKYELTQLNEAYELVGVAHDFDLSKQYVGSSESIFYKFLLKKQVDEVQNP
ncbi:MAG: hypothetical protein MRZ79_25755 [Bacteroidia bacterium]|nr:hypothetical protein [Bacteroidia bacterium]